MKKVLTLISAVFFTVLSTNANAGLCWECKVASISSGSGAICNGTDACVLIRLNAAAYTVERSSCSTSPNWHFALDTSTNAGKTLLAQLIIAQQTNQSFAFIGSGNCALSAGSEDLIRGYNPW